MSYPSQFPWETKMIPPLLEHYSSATEVWNLQLCQSRAPSSTSKGVSQDSPTTSRVLRNSGSISPTPRYLPPVSSLKLPQWPHPRWWVSHPLHPEALHPWQMMFQWDWGEPQNIPLTTCQCLQLWSAKCHLYNSLPPKLHESLPALL